MKQRQGKAKIENSASTHPNTHYDHKTNDDYLLELQREWGMCVCSVAFFFSSIQLPWKLRGFFSSFRRKIRQ